jgi:hypothetical protein
MVFIFTLGRGCGFSGLSRGRERMLRKKTHRGFLKIRISSWGDDLRKADLEKNRPKSAPFTSLRTDYVHPPNDPEGNVLESGNGKNHVGLIPRDYQANSPVTSPRQKNGLRKIVGNSRKFQDLRDRESLPPARESFISH